MCISFIFWGSKYKLHVWCSYCSTAMVGYVCMYVFCSVGPWCGYQFAPVELLLDLHAALCAFLSACICIWLCWWVSLRKLRASLTLWWCLPPRLRCRRGGDHTAMAEEWGSTSHTHTAHPSIIDRPLLIQVAEPVLLGAIVHYDLYPKIINLCCFNPLPFPVAAA